MGRKKRELTVTLQVDPQSAPLTGDRFSSLFFGMTMDQLAADLAGNWESKYAAKAGRRDT